MIAGLIVSILRTLLLQIAIPVMLLYEDSLWVCELRLSNFSE